MLLALQSVQTADKFSAGGSAHRACTTSSALVTHMSTHNTVHRASQPRTPAVAAVTLFIQQTGVQDKHQHTLWSCSRQHGRHTVSTTAHLLEHHNATGQRMARQTSHVAAHCSAARRSQDTCSTRARTSCDMTSWLCQPQHNPHMHRNAGSKPQNRKKLCGSQATMWTPATATSTHS